MKEHNMTFEAVIKRAVDFGIPFNPKTCQNGVEEIEVFGHKFTDKWLRQTPEKIRAVKESSPPE